MSHSFTLSGLVSRIIGCPIIAPRGLHDPAWTAVRHVPTRVAAFSCGRLGIGLNQSGVHDNAGMNPGLAQTNEATHAVRRDYEKRVELSTELIRRTRSFVTYAWLNASLRAHSMKTDSDSDHSPSEDEKKVGVEAGAFESLATHQLPPDPDEGLSDAQKAAIVSSSPYYHTLSSRLARTRDSSSSSTSDSFPGSVCSI